MCFKNSGGLAAAEKKAASCSKAPLPPITLRSRSIPGPICLNIGPRLRTTSAIRFKNSGGGSEEKKAKLLEGAVVAFRSALEIYTKANLPQYWAMTQNNMGIALAQLASRYGGTNRQLFEPERLDSVDLLTAISQRTIFNYDKEKSRKLLEEAVAAFRSALEVYAKADLPQYWAATQSNLGITLLTLGVQLKGEEGLKRQRESVELLRDVVSYQPDDQSRYWLASALADLAPALVLNSQFAEAQTRCEEAQRLTNEIGNGVYKTELDDVIFIIQQNLAHALLFQGHYDEALAIYRKYWDKWLFGQTFGESTLEDFAAFDEAGLAHPDLPRMKRALGDLPSKAPSP